MAGSGKGPMVPINHDVDVPLGVKVMMRITHISSLDAIYLTWNNAPRYHDPEKLNAPDRILKKKSSVRVEDYCVVHHEGDILNNEGYCRAQILSIEGNSCQVELIDFGPTVTVPVTNLWTLPKEYYQQRRLAFRFGLKNVKSTGHSSSDYNARSIIENTFGLAGYAMVYISKIATPLNNIKTRRWGRLFSERQYSVADMLIKGNLGLPMEKTQNEVFRNPHMFTDVTYRDEKAAAMRTLMSGENFKCRILRGAQSLKSFSIIREKEEDLNLKIEELVNRTLSLGLSAYHPWILGTACLCLIEHSNRKWYRGRVLLINETSVARVKLLDTGEHQDIEMKELKEMPRALKDILPLAYACKLPLEPQTSACVPYPGFAPTPNFQLNDADQLRRLYKLNDVCYDKGLVAWVLANSGFRATIDFKLLANRTTYAYALLQIKELMWEGDVELLQEIKDEVSGDKNMKLLEMTEDMTASSIFWSKKFRPEEQEITPTETKEFKDFNNLPSSIVAMELMTKEKDPCELPEFHFDRIEKLKDLNTLVGRVFVFNRLIGFNILTLVEENTCCPQLTELDTEIEDWIRSGEGNFKLGEVTKVHHVVLAPFTKSRYCRARVEELKIIGGVRIAFLKFIEHGTVVRFPMSDLKQPNRKIMQFRQLVHFVKLDDVDDDVPLLGHHFYDLRNSLDKLAVLCRVVKTQARSFPTVILAAGNANLELPYTRLSTMLNDLAIWPWQRLFHAMYTTYPEISKKYDWGHYDMQKFLLDFSVMQVLKRSNCEMRVQRRSLREGWTLQLSGVPEDGNLLYQHRTVQTQINKYIEKVVCECMSCKDVMTCEHLLAVKFNDALQKQQAAEKIYTNCNWHRCFFNFAEESLMCMDCFWEGKPENGEFSGCTIRRLPPDFYQGCPIGLTCSIDVSFIKRDRAEEIVNLYFPRGKSVSVFLTSRSPQYNDDLPSFTAEILGLKQALMKRFDEDYFQ